MAKTERPQKQNSFTESGWIRFWVITCLLIPFFGIFAYNSGYGYDSLEYLIIGRSLDDGYQLYDFIPSKSWLWYIFVWFGIKITGLDFNHLSNTILIIILFVLVGTSVFAVVKKITKNPTQALMAAVLTMICSFFMEMNFLEPEAPIVIVAVWAAWFVLKDKWLLGGILIGISVLFKSVGMFYAAGAGFYLIYQFFIGNLENWKSWLTKSFLLGVGFFIPLIFSLGIFYLTGKLEEHVYWSYVYPFQGYPAHTLFLKKLIFKTFWFIGITLAALIISLMKSNYHKFWKQDSLFTLSFFMGLFSLVALLKTQASHYLYTAAPFFSIVVAAVFSQYLKKQKHTKTIVYAGLAAVAMVGVSTLIFRPDAIKRFFMLHSYEEGDNFFKGQFDKYLAKDDKALFLDHGFYYYFHAHRYPNVPFICTEMQTTDYIRRYPDTYHKALNDPSLKLVVFGNRKVELDDSTMVDLPSNRIALDNLKKDLADKFQSKYDSSLQVNVWLRKQ